jgi:hypothetical protein
MNIAIGVFADETDRRFTVRVTTEPTTRVEVAQRPAAPDLRDHRVRGRFLTPRLYPEAPFDPWEPAFTYGVTKLSM